MAQVFQIVIFVAQENAHFDPQKGPLKGDKKIIKLWACILLSIYVGALPWLVDSECYLLFLIQRKTSQ